MSYPFSLPSNMIVMQALQPKHGTAAAEYSTAISMKNVQKMWAIVNINTSASSGAVTVIPQTDALVAFGSAAVLTNAVPIWMAADVATSPVLVRQTNAVNQATNADALLKCIVFEIDPQLHFGTTEKCFRIACTVAAADWWSVTYIILPRYAQATSIDVLTD